MASRLGLLLLLAVALGGFLCLFDLFTGLKSSGSNDLLEQNSSLGSAMQVNSGFDLVTPLTAITWIALGIGSFFLLRKALKGRLRNRYLAGVIAALPAAVMEGVGLYFAAAGFMGRDLPFVDGAYSHHEVNPAGVEPLGLALLASFLLSVALIGIVRPRGLPVVLAARDFTCGVRGPLNWSWSCPSLRKTCPKYGGPGSTLELSWRCWTKRACLLRGGL